jgi:hypothetical protein
LGCLTLLFLGLGLGVFVGIGVDVGVGVLVGVAVDVAVGVDVGVNVGVAVGVLVGVAVKVAVAVGVNVNVAFEYSRAIGNEFSFETANEKEGVRNQNTVSVVTNRKIRSQIWNAGRRFFRAFWLIESGIIIFGRSFCSVTWSRYL